MMRHVLTIVFFGILLLSNVCFARDLEIDELTMGGLPLGCSMDDVQSVYGSPDAERSVGDGYTGECVIWKYGETLSIKFRDGALDGVTTTADNGFATLAGAYVGMPVYQLDAMYGKPMNYVRNRKTAGKGMLYYRTVRSRNLGMRFDFEKGKISRIMTGLFDG